MRTYFTGRNGLFTLITVLCIVTVRHPAAAGAGVPQDAIIYGCVDANSGRIRLIGAARGACLPSETPISWNLQGPKGDTGAIGPQGTQGIPGIQGPPGTPADMTRVSNLQNAVNILQNQVNSLNGLLSRVTNLENFNRWSTFNAVVDCGAGQTVAAALADAARYQSSNITIRGICHEAVVINNNNTFITGEPGAGFALPQGDDRPVLSIAATGGGLNNLTVTGGRIGIATGMRVAMIFRNVAISGSTWAGIWLNGGSIELDHSTITGTSGTGIWSWKNALITINASTISANAFAGVYAERSTVMLDQGTVLSGNGTGLSLINGSSATMNDAKISANLGFGMTIWQASTATLGDKTVITGNGGDGINLKDTGVLGAYAGPVGSGASVVNNTGYGVFCSGATAQILGVTWNGVDVSGNTRGQLVCPIVY